MRTRSLLFGLVLMLVTPVGAVPPLNTDGDGVAIGGYDPVAFVTDGNAIPSKRLRENWLSSIDANIRAADAAWAAEYAGR